MTERTLLVVLVFGRRRFVFEFWLAFLLGIQGGRFRGRHGISKTHSVFYFLSSWSNARLFALFIF